MARRKTRHTQKKDYWLLLEVSVVVGIILLGYYLFGSGGERVGQAIGTEGCAESAQCDGSDLKGASCSSLGFAAGGELRCSDCRFDTLLCTTCGNGQLDKGEQCDGASMGAQQSCSGLDPSWTGQLGCTRYCLYDVRGCSG